MISVQEREHLQSRLLICYRPEVKFSRLTIMRRALQQIPSTAGNTDIQTVQQDFVFGELPYHDIDGVLMANSLHYVKNKNHFIQKMRDDPQTDSLFSYC